MRTGSSPVAGTIYFRYMPIGNAGLTAARLNVSQLNSLLEVDQLFAYNEYAPYRFLTKGRKKNFQSQYQGIKLKPVYRLGKPAIFVSKSQWILRSISCIIYVEVLTMKYVEKSLEKDRNCAYCKRRMVLHSDKQSKEQRYLSATKDHLICKRLGGKNDYDNYVICCQRCNNLKGTVPYEVFKTFSALILIPYPDLPLNVLRSALNDYCMLLLEAVVSNRKAMRNACSVTLLNLSQTMNLYAGRRKIDGR